MAVKVRLKNYLPVLSYQFSIRTKDAASIVQSIPRTFGNRAANYSDLQKTSNFRKHGGGRRCITTSINVFGINWEAVIRIGTVPNLLQLNNKSLIWSQAIIALVYIEELGKQTGKRMSLAPFSAASSMALRAWAMFLSLSAVTDNWQSPTLNWTK